MATCSTCKHWDRGLAPDPYGTCAFAEADEGNPVMGETPTHPVLAADPDSYHASLYTLPTFGCNQHVARVKRRKK